jgi:heat shock protein HspQ|tara:strand:+ start:265 stop:609 length:345 start_codon:yes stop_codon:yes gene_type:complete
VSKKTKIQSSPIFCIGDVVRHRHFPFRGVIFDVDPEFANTEEWYQSVPAEIRPVKEQPFYHLLAENEDTYYTAYVSQQNLLPDGDSGPIDHPELIDLFDEFDGDRYQPRRDSIN